MKHTKIANEISQCTTDAVKVELSKACSYEKIDPNGAGVQVKGGLISRSQPKHPWCKKSCGQESKKRPC